MGKITLQSIFDKAWEAFVIGDNDPGYDKNLGQCVYVDGKGNKCAVGLSLPENSELQGNREGFSELYDLFPELFDIDETFDLDLDDFQYALHDNHVDSDTGYWKNTKEDRKAAYLTAAEDYGLETSHLPGA